MTIHPSVMIDGKRVEVPGFMFVLAFALRGIRWAIEEADKPEFREQVKEWIRNQHNKKIEEEINDHL
jgi:hypothetical protein